MDFDRNRPVLTVDQISAIRAVLVEAKTQYAALDIAKTIEFFRRRYVDQAKKYMTLSAGTVVADVGTGYGWLALAFALYTPAKIIAMDLGDIRSMAAAKKIAAIAGVADRIDFRVGGLGDAPLQTSEADLVCCIEVLEHVSRNKAAVRDLGRITKSHILVTTPNLLFPAIAHDTRLPFAHWLPRPLRRIYARALGRLEKERGNKFWAPFELDGLLSDFKVVSKFMHYRSLDDMLETFPTYLPYGKGSQVKKIRGLRLAYFQAVALLGSASRWVLPNLAAVYQRRPN